MNFIIEPYTRICALKTFSINGITADTYDFGEGYDAGRGLNSLPYCCENRVFKTKPSTPEVLTQYNITEAEYDEIAEKLSEVLSFGSCCWCL